MCTKPCRDEVYIAFLFFVRAIWKCPNLHDLQVYADFKLSYFSQKRGFANENFLILSRCLKIVFQKGLLVKLQKKFEFFELHGTEFSIVTENGS